MRVGSPDKPGSKPDLRSNQASTHDLLAESLAILSGERRPNRVVETWPSCRSAEGFAVTHNVCESDSEETAPTVKLREGQ